MSVKVALIARPTINFDAMRESGYNPHPLGSVTDADELAEYAGRQCYLSWDRPNPHTASNSAYIDNVVQKQCHESIIEHAHVVVRITGISRSLLLELERHRHLSFSVLSQRYVDEAERNADPVIPPLFRGTKFEDRLHNVYNRLLKEYAEIAAEAEEQLKDASRKQVREAARAVLPNMTSTEALVSANLRTWRYVIQLRRSPHADAEIQELARELLDVMRRVAPACFQDIT